MGKVWRKRKWRWFRQCFNLFFALLVLTAPAFSDRKKRYGELCHKTQDCDTDLFLKCDNGMCRCENEKNSILENGHCRVLAGQSCEDNPFCVQDAQCIKGTCECFKPMFMSMSNGSCLLGPGVRCDNSVPCNPEGPLACVNEICSCPPLTTFSWNDRKCLGLIGASCSPSSSSRTCIDNAVCTLTNNRGVCKCSPQYTPTRDFSCSLRFEENCLGTGNLDTFAQCNSDDNLNCNEITGKCECLFPDQMTYQEPKGEKGECRLLAGEPCYLSNTSISSMNQGLESLQCVSGSTCTGVENGMGRCQCNSGYRETNTRTCVVHNNKGKSDLILKCILNRKAKGLKVCICKEGYVWIDSVCTLPNLKLSFPSSSVSKYNYFHFTILIFTLSCIILSHKLIINELLITPL